VNLVERKIPAHRAVKILAQNNIVVNDDEAFIILDFLCYIAKTYKSPKKTQILK